MSAPEPPPDFDISSSEANTWWRTNDPAGAILNRLMLALVIAPALLAYNEYYKVAFVVFAFIVPYGLLVRYLAVNAVKRRIANDPESLSEFREAGIVRGNSGTDPN
jgi:uncharacterized membrane protein